jgi:outer membrane protein assembly factor BamE
MSTQRPEDPAPPLWPLLLAAGLLGGCASLQSEDNFLGVVTPYRIEIVQGNVVTKEQAALVRPGFTRNQVRDILGSPLLTDLFHADRWDYVFTIKRQGTAPQRRAIVARFEGDLLKALDAPADLPSEREFVASISRTSATGRETVLELTDQQRQALPKPPAVDAEPVRATGAKRPYPPLEPQ